MNREIHYRYAIAFLFASIVLLVALSYFDVPNLIDKFEFALTLSSLLLAILAIFYTIVAGQKQDTQLTKLIETNSQIGSATDEIRLAARDISEFTKDAPKHFERLGLKIDSMSDTFGSLSSTQEELVQQSFLEEKLAISAKQFSQIFRELQFGAMKVLYLFERCSWEGKPIPLSALGDFGIVSKDYVAGCLTVFNSIGLLEFKLHAGEILAIECADVVREGLKGNLDSVISVVSESTANSLKATIKSVDEFIAP